MRECAIALGMFDGVHMGHRAVLKTAVKSGFESVAVTFRTLSFKGGGLLMTPEKKEQSLLSLGIDEVLFLDFEKVRNMEPETFLSALSARYPVRRICCGFNYRFGKNAAGDTDLLNRYCEKQGIEFFECPPVQAQGITVSSTLIRSLVSQGEAAKAAELLGGRFGFEETVIHGDERGRTIGFPTANQIFPTALVKPKFGVYRTVVTVDGKSYNGVTNIGVRPTYQTDFISAETYILDFSGELYGKRMQTELVEFLREEKRFDSAEELAGAIRRNAEYVKAVSQTETGSIAASDKKS